MPQRLIYGVADPFAYHNAGATTTGDDLAAFCEDWRRHHLALAWLSWADCMDLRGVPAREGGALGIVIAATDSYAWQPRVNTLEEVSAPPLLGELISLRLTGGIQQAMLDWELVRLSARLLDLDLPPGRICLLEEPHNQGSIQ